MLNDSRKSSRPLPLFVLIILFTLAACDRGTPPSRSLEVAVQGVYGASISADASHAVIASMNHGGSLWSLDDSERLYNWNHKSEGFTELTAAAFSPDGQYAVTADYQNLVLWEVQTGKGIRFWTSPDQILDLDLMPDARYALLGMENYTAVLFDVQIGGVRRVFHHDNRVRSVSLSADGRFALTGSEDHTARLWDTETGDMVQKIEHDDEVRLVELSPDGEIAFSVSKYDTAMLWRTEDGELIGELPMRSFALQRGLTFQSARFSNDGSELLTGTSDRVVQLWSTKSLRSQRSWTIPKRDAWKPNSAAVLALGFEKSGGAYWAVSSNGFLHRLK